VKPVLLTITLFICLTSFAQRQYGVEDTSNRRQVELNLSKDAVKVFPNPVVNDLYITIKMNGLLIKTVFIYDKDGTRMIEQKVQSTLAAPIKVNVSRLEQGLYYLVLETNKQPYRMQLLKQ
jgi:hypothetical protein